MSSAWRPQREVEIIAGTPPGGGLDRCARALAKAIEGKRLLDVPVRVNNIAGEGGRGARAHLDQHPGDPRRLCISSVNLTTDHLLARFATGAASVTVALSTSLGNPNHIALAKVVRHAGGDVKAPKIRVFDSALDAVADVVAGNADVGAITAASPVNELAAGTLRALAVSAPRRLPGLYEQTPTWTEQSVDCVIGAWRGVTGARGLAPEVVAFWEKTLTAATASAEWNAELARHYWTPMHLHGTLLREYLARERTEMRTLLGELGLLKQG